VVGKAIGDVRIALIGTGAANVATYRLLKAYGADPGALVACDSSGTLHPGREDLKEQQDRYAQKWTISQETNADQIIGGIPEAMEGADVCIALSKPGPDTIKPEWVADMADDAIVFPCANPIPEIWPWEAREAGARIVGTGRSDFPNQINNSLGFPAIFRGVLDVRAKTITDEMAIAAAEELARCAEEQGLDEEHIVPSMDDWQVFPREAVATAMKAQEQGIARLEKTREELYERAEAIIRQSREAVTLMMEEEIIPSWPD
jgi:malate dehydrogenase (oxaloacetate-decarboxylating)